MGPEGIRKRNPKLKFALLAALALPNTSLPANAENSGAKPMSHTVSEIKNKKKSIPPAGAEGHVVKPNINANFGAVIAVEDPIAKKLKTLEVQKEYESLKQRIENAHYPHLAFGNPAEAPTGYQQMCARLEEFCKTLKLTTKKHLTLTPELFATLNKINKTVNAEIKPVSDLETSGRSEYWNPLAGKGSEGDCEDYVWAKFLRLDSIDNFPIQDLTPTTVLDENDKGHLVLGVQVFVDEKLVTLTLDNRWDGITLLSESGYEYLKGTQIHEGGVEWFDVDVAFEGPEFDTEHE